MAYQIPQQLAYKEKIMFGLTFKQLLYAFLFGSISIILFRKIDNLTLGCILGSVPSIIGLGFIFFDLEEKIKNYYLYCKLRKSENKKLVELFGIKEIKDNLIITSKNKKIAILKVNTINFSIKPSNEKEAIISSFQKFLNSLDFPTQILINTESIKLEDYLKSLKSRVKQKQFGELFEKYKSHLEDTIKNNKIMNRTFYLVIPETTDIGIQINICFDRLASLNLKAKQLSSYEIKKLLVNFFNGKGTGGFPNYIFPSHINNNKTYLEVVKKLKDKKDKKSKENFEKVKEYDLVKEITEKIEENLEILEKLMKSSEANMTLDLYSNALRRENENRFDDALARFYACLEKITQHQLKKYNIETNNPDYSKLDKEVVEKFTKKIGFLPNELELKKNALLLYLLGDEIGKEIEKIGYKIFTGLIGMRNNSILAHGIKPVNEKNLLDFKNILMGPILKKFIKLNNLNEEELNKHTHLKIKELTSLLLKKTHLPLVK